MTSLFRVTYLNFTVKYDLTLFDYFEMDISNFQMAVNRKQRVINGSICIKSNSFSNLAMSVTSVSNSDDILPWFLTKITTQTRFLATVSVGDTCALKIDVGSNLQKT